MFRRVLAVVVVAVAATWGLSTPAHALPYPPPIVDSGTVSTGAIEPGGTVTFSGDGFAAGSPILVTVDGPENFEAEVEAGGDGSFAVDVTLEEVGTYELTATGVTEDGGVLVLSNTVRVMADDAGAPVRDDDGAGVDTGGLPRTGAEGTLTQVWAGVALLGLGIGMVALTVVRRRQGGPAA